MRKVTVAKHAGFCFGVARAVQTAYDLLAAGNTAVYALGNLIHNPQILAELAELGMQTVTEAEIDGIAASATTERPAVLLIRAHGITRRINEHLTELTTKHPAFSVADCTCPYVKNIHTTVEKHATENTVLVVIGDENHPEVQGITSYAQGDVAVFDDLDVLAHHQFNQKPAIVVAQTTQNLEKWKKSKEILKKGFTNVNFFDTICNVTEKRQTETVALAGSVDLMLVIGGRESSNTRKLYEIARAAQPRTHFVEQLSDLPDPKTLGSDTIIGITAGASTPSRIIEEAKAIMEEKVTTSEIVESFEQMLEESLKTVHKGEVVEAIVASVSTKGLQLDLGAKVTGFIPADELSEPSDKLAEIYKIGDTVSAKVIEYSDKEGTATLSKKLVDALRSWDEIKSAYENGTVIEGKIVRETKGGLRAVVEGTEVFIPASLSGVARGEALTPMVGTVQKFRITEVDAGKRSAIGSIKAVLAAEKKAREEAIWASIEEGAEITGPVRSLVPYGAFVDLGGIDGLVHITELSWRRLKHPSEVLKVGDMITVRIKKIDRETKRISLGYKTEESNPWTMFNNQFEVGSVASVKIVSLVAYGAFAEILPGVDGLIHISQIADRKLAHPSDALKVGDVVEAKITAIDDEKQNVSLSIRALSEDTAAEDAE